MGFWNFIKAGYNEATQWVDENVIEPAKEGYNEATQWVDENVIEPAKEGYNEATQWVDENVIEPTKEGYNEATQVVNEQITAPAKKTVEKYIIEPLKSSSFRFGYYSPLSSADSEAGYFWYRLRDGETNVRARFDENGYLQIHPDDLQLSVDVENRVWKGAMIRGFIPTAPLMRNGVLHSIPEAYDPTLRELDFKANNQFELKVIIGNSAVVNGEAFIDGLNWIGRKFQEWERRRQEEDYQSALRFSRDLLEKSSIDESDPNFEKLLVQHAYGYMQAQDLGLVFSGGVKFSGPKVPMSARTFAKVSNKAINSEIYAGTREASEYLKSQGVSRQFRKQILESFDSRTIKLKVADENTYGLRFFDGINAQAKGRYLFESFDNLTNRGNLALPPEWNTMSGIKQWKVKPGTKIITGEAAPQFEFGSQYVGGEKQWYIINLDNLLEPKS